MDSLTQAWLIERGYALVRSNHFCVDYCWSDERCRVPVIKCGPTPRSKAMNQHHSVIYIRDEMVYDPHPSNAGLTAVCDEYMVVKLPLPEAAL